MLTINAINVLKRNYQKSDNDRNELSLRVNEKLKEYFSFFFSLDIDKKKNISEWIVGKEEKEINSILFKNNIKHIFYGGCKKENINIESIDHSRLNVVLEDGLVVSSFWG